MSKSIEKYPIHNIDINPNRIELKQLDKTPCTKQNTDVIILLFSLIL